MPLSIEPASDSLGPNRAKTVPDIPMDLDTEGLLLAAAAINVQAWRHLTKVPTEDFHDLAHQRLASALLSAGPLVTLAFDPDAGQWLPPAIGGPDRAVLARAMRSCWTPLLAPEWAEKVRAVAFERRAWAAAAELVRCTDPEERRAALDTLRAVVGRAA